VRWLLPLLSNRGQCEEDVKSTPDWTLRPNGIDVDGSPHAGSVREASGVRWQQPPLSDHAQYGTVASAKAHVGVAFSWGWGKWTIAVNCEKSGGSSSCRFPAVVNTEMDKRRGKRRHRFFATVMQKNDCCELREKRWLLPPHSKVLRTQLGQCLGNGGKYGEGGRIEFEGKAKRICQTGHAVRCIS
jgi:hypothetical protein